MGPHGRGVVRGQGAGAAGNGERPLLDAGSGVTERCASAGILAMAPSASGVMMYLERAKNIA